MGLFNWPSKNKQSDERYVPPVTNRHLGVRKTTEEFEDEYTRKQAAETEYLKRVGSFINADGREMPIGRLNGQTKQLLKEAREAIQEETAANKIMKRAEPTGTEEDTPEAAKNEVFAEKMRRDNPHSIHKFYNNHGRHLTGENAGERIGTKLGLYKDYNPKLNAGAPGNREERNRQARQEAEKNKGLQPPEEPTFEDYLSDRPEFKDED